MSCAANPGDRSVSVPVPVSVTREVRVMVHLLSIHTPTDVYESTVGLHRLYGMAYCPRAKCNNTINVRHEASIYATIASEALPPTTSC